MSKFFWDEADKKNKFMSSLKLVFFKLRGCKKYILLLDKEHMNTEYYFDSKNKLFCDFYIRYENIDEDFKKVCKKIGIPYEKLPKTKNKTRKDGKHYSTYYNEETKNKIEKLCEREIKFFDYNF